MACTPLTNGIVKDCSINLGGVLNVYIADFDAVSGITASGGVISSLTLSGTSSFYEFQFNRNTSSLEVATSINLENGSTFYNQTVNLVIAKRDVQKRNTLALLTSGQKRLAVIVKDQNGTYWYVGKNEGAYVTEMGGGTGTTKADLNGYNITINAEDSEDVYEVDETLIPTITT